MPVNKSAIIFELDNVAVAADVDVDDVAVADVDVDVFPSDGMVVSAVDELGLEELDNEGANTNADDEVCLEDDDDDEEGDIKAFPLYTLLLLFASSSTPSA